MIALPSGVWATSGWNWSPTRPSRPIAATGEFAEQANTVKPGGGVSMWSPWLIQTARSDGRFAKSGDEPSAATVIVAGPYSRRSAGATAPPRASANSCIP